MATISLAGKYLGRSKVREGREDELSPQERKQLQKASNVVDLELREDGSFTKQVTAGTWRQEGARLVFAPTHFGGKTLQEMQQAAEEMGRVFGLAFVFNEFELLVSGEALLTPDENSLIYTEFTRAWSAGWHVFTGVGLIKEFREFAVKGNVIDLAVGVIIGAAFGKIVSSLVEDVVMPPVGMVTGQVDFAQLKWVLKDAVVSGDKEVEKAVTLNYGNFLNNVIQFAILAFVIFLMVKAINNAKARFTEPPPASEPVVKECPYCRSEVPLQATKCKFCTSEIA